MKKAILPILLLLSYTAIAQTINWDGGGNGISWTDPLNWDLNRVPNSTDFILIAASTTDLTIELDGAGEGAALELDAAGQNINFTITAEGVLTLIDTDPLFNEDGISVDSRMGGNILFTNNGEIFVQKNGDSGTDDGINLEAGGPGGAGSAFTFINNNVIRIRDTWNGGIYLELNSNAGASSFDNNGFIEIINSSLAESVSSIESGSSSSIIDFTNDGTIIINGSGYLAIDLNENTEFTNNGLLQIKGEILEDILEISGSGASFTNNSLIQIDAVTEEDAIDHGGNASFINALCGVINVSSQNAISFGSGTVSNAGIITSANTGNANSGSITNTGEIRTPNGTGNGLSVNGGSTTTGPIPAEESISSNCPALPSLPEEEVVADVPVGSYWAKLGLMVLMLSFSIFLAYHRKL